MRLKKTLAFALAIAMVFGIVSFAAAAPAAHGTAFNDVPADHPKARQITALGALGISVGTSGLGGSFNPDGTLKRAEFATFAVRLAGLEATAQALAGFKPTFNDANNIPEWAWGYINVAQSEGIVVGDDKGNFNADQDVTYAEALTMLVRVTGWKDTVTGTNWPVNYMARAIALDISKGVTLTANTPLSRADMAALLYNAGFVSKPEMQDGKWTGKTIADSSLFHDSTKRGVVTEYNSAAGTLAINGHGALSLADDVYLSGVASLSATVGRQVTAHLNGADKVVFVSADAAADEITGVFKGTKAGDGANYLELNDGTLIRYNADTQVSINGGIAAKNVGLLNAGDSVSITTEKGIAASVAVTRLSGDLRLDKNAQPKKENDVASYDHVEISGKKLRVSRATVTLNGEVVDFSELKKDDVVRVALVGGTALASAVDGDHAYRIDATRNTVAGTIDDVKVVVDGSKYRLVYTVKLADATEKEVTWDPTFSTYAEAVGAAYGGKGTFLLNAEGRAAFFEGPGVVADAIVVKYVGSDGATDFVDEYGVIRDDISLGGVANEDDLHALMWKDGSTWKLVSYDIDAAHETEVVSVDEDAGIVNVKYKSGGKTFHYVVNNAVVYGQQYAGKRAATNYLGVAGLKAGDKVAVHFKSGAVLKLTTTAANLKVTVNPDELADGYAPDTKITVEVSGHPISLKSVGSLAVKAAGVDRTVTPADVTANSLTFQIQGGLAAGDHTVELSFKYAGDTWTASATIEVLDP